MKPEDGELIYTRTGAITEKIKAVSGMISDLNITHEQNDRLVAALTELQCTTEKEMLAQGMAIWKNTLSKTDVELGPAVFYQ